MKREDIKAGDVLTSFDGRGVGYYRVLKVCAVKVRVVGENGNTMLHYPRNFSRKVASSKLPQMRAEGIHV